MILLYENGKSKYISDTNDISDIINDSVKYVLLNVGIDGCSRYVPIKAKCIITKLEKCIIKYSIGAITNFVDLVYLDDSIDPDILRLVENKLSINTIEKFYSYLFSFTNIDFYNLLSGRMEYMGLPPLDIYELTINIVSDKIDNKFTIVKKSSKKSKEYDGFTEYFIDDFIKLCKVRFHLFEVAVDLNNHNKILIFNKNKTWNIQHIKNDDELILSKKVRYFTVIDTVCGSIFMVTPFEYYLFNDIYYIDFTNIILDAETYQINTKQDIVKIIELYNDVSLNDISVLELNLGKTISGLITFITLLKIIVVIHKMVWVSDQPDKLTSVSQLNITTTDGKVYIFYYTEELINKFNVNSFLHEFIKIKRGRQYENDKIM